MIDAVSGELGPDAAKRVLKRVCDDRVAASEAQMDGLPLADRVEVLKSLYFESDPYMEVQPADDGFYLIERNCPFFNTAMRRPILCSVSVNALTRLLGVRVDREERFQDGQGRCVFHIRADQPVDVNAWQFVVEE